MGTKWAMTVGAGLGAGLMYFYDPQSGNQRRAWLRDQRSRLGRKAQNAASAVGADVSNRAQGAVAGTQSRWGQPTSDSVLQERVRAAIGHVSSHPGAIDVVARDGEITLRGPVLTSELPLVIDRLYGIRGVRDVKNQLEPHAEAGNVPGLQGSSTLGRGGASASAKQNWSPSARLAAGAGGAGLALWGLARGGFFRSVLGIGGIVLAARAATNLNLSRLTGIGARRRAVDIQKSIRINAPIERVFEIWSNCDNYPQFMTHVRSVRRLDNGASGKRWRWTVAGPIGSEFTFDTTTTAYEPNRVIAWRTEPGALVQHAGIVRFNTEANGTTRADVQLSYNPVAGAIGHVIGKLFGADAKRQLDDDLQRMKTFVETGRRAHDAAAAQGARPSM